MQLPDEFLDPETARCCILLGHLGDPDVPRGFNVTVPHQQQWIVQSVLFVTARLLTFLECQHIRKFGAQGRAELGTQFVKSKEFSVSNVPLKLWSNLKIWTEHTQKNEKPKTGTEINNAKNAEINNNAKNAVGNSTSSSSSTATSSLSRTSTTTTPIGAGASMSSSSDSDKNTTLRPP